MIRILRSGVAAGAIGALSVTLAGLGVATAANGGSLILGHSNTATSTTTVANSHGTPLSLVGKSSKPPLKVSSSKRVAHLNASLLGGKSATGLATNGSGEQTPFTTLAKLFTPISTSSSAATEIARTAKLTRGTYYVAAAATGFNKLSGHPTTCFIGPDANADDALQSTVADAGAESMSVLAVTKVAHRTKLGEYCYADDSDVDSGTIFAIKIAHSAGGSLPPPKF